MVQLCDLRKGLRQVSGRGGIKLFQSRASDGESWLLGADQRRRPWSSNAGGTAGCAVWLRPAWFASDRNPRGGRQHRQPESRRESRRRTRSRAAKAPLDSRRVTGRRDVFPAAGGRGIVRRSIIRAMSERTSRRDLVREFLTYI